MTDGIIQHLGPFGQFLSGLAGFLTMAAVCISDDALTMPKIQAPEAYSPSYDVAKDFNVLTTGVAAADVKIHSVRIVAVKGDSEF